MKKIIFVFIAFCAIVNTQGQTNTVSKGAALLFKNAKTKLNAVQKSKIFDSLGFKISKDEKQFISDGESADYAFDALFIQLI